jgi:hypothetical protein
LTVFLGRGGETFLEDLPNRILMSQFLHLEKVLRAYIRAEEELLDFRKKFLAVKHKRL